MFSALVAIGVLRPSLPEAIRDHWSGWVVALAAVTFGVVLLWARSRESREERFEAYLLALLPLVLAALYLQPQRVASDGIFYYSPLHSLVVDGDLDFANEYRVLGAPAGYFQRTETGRLPNNFSIGPALLWLPWFVLAHLLGALGPLPPDRIRLPLFFTAIATGTVAAGFVGVVCLFRFVRAYFPSGIAFVSTLLVWLATFHVWYMVFEPSMSHAMAMASVAGFLLLTHEGAHGVKAYVLLGALGGVVALMRWQNVVFVPVALAVSWSMHGRPRVREIAAAGAAFLLVFSPQLLYWKALYGSFFLIPQGGGYIDWTAPELEAVLFSSRHGLLSWAPVLWLGVLGLPEPGVVVRRRRRRFFECEGRARRDVRHGVQLPSLDGAEKRHGVLGQRQVLLVWRPARARASFIRVWPASLASSLTSWSTLRRRSVVIPLLGNHSLRRTERHVTRTLRR